MKFLVHPGVNSASVKLDAAGLEVFLKWVDGGCVSVDLRFRMRAATESHNQNW